MRRVVVTGMGALSPIGNSVEESWNGIKNKVCGIDNITYFDTSDFNVKLAGELKNFDLKAHFNPKIVKNTDKFCLYARVAAKEAMVDANIDLEAIDHDRFGVIVASGIGGIDTLENQANVLFKDGPSRLSAYFIPKTLINLAPGQIAMDFKANGYCSSVVTACAASTNAIGDAFNRIRFGFEDIMIAGGAEASITRLGVGGFQALRALSVETNPSRASIPFDAERKGFVMGEGAGMLVLEELEHALNRGAKIYAELVGYGVSCDAHHITAPLEDGSISSKCLVNAMNDAKIAPKDIGYINVHGTSTHLNDLTETNAIKLAFKENAYDVLISSTKSNTGHLLGAAGAIESIFTIKALETSIIPPTINYQVKDPQCDLNIVVNEPIHKDIQYALTTNLGFGGHNASLVFKKWEA